MILAKKFGQRQVQQLGIKSMRLSEFVSASMVMYILRNTVTGSQMENVRLVFDCRKRSSLG
jgi:hypothetical protein